MASKEQLERLKRSAETRSQRVNENKNQVTLVYVPDGVTKFRPYLDKEGEVLRTGFRHKYGKLSIPCNGSPECKVCNRLKEISDGWDGAWRFGSQEYTLLYVWIFECSDTQNDYIKLNEPVILMGTSRLANEVSFLIKETDINDLEETFDPSTPSLMWQLRYDRDKRSLSVGYYNRKASMDPLPESFPALSDCYYKKDASSNPDKEAEFLSLLEKAYQKSLSLGESQSFKPESTIHEPVSQKPLENPKSEFTGQRYPVKSGDQKPVCFGHHSDSYDDPDCLLCKLETKCESVTSK